MVKPWLTSAQQRVVVEKLLGWGLIKFDPDGTLPLSNGGTTDIYIDLRSSRSNPEAAEYIADLFASQLNGAGIERFAEVPNAMSGIAGMISLLTGMPYFTIRKVELLSRRADARIIGDVGDDDVVALIDDVINDAGTKVPALELCKRRGVRVKAVIVLVERGDDWKRTFTEHGLNDVAVWPAMTLSEMREHLASLRS